jgi:hypothetical protein
LGYLPPAEWRVHWIHTLGNIFCQTVTRTRHRLFFIIPITKFLFEFEESIINY